MEGFRSIWPKPSAVAWKIIACFAAFEAILQLALPGQRVEGPISPTGNRPVYKVGKIDSIPWKNLENNYSCILDAFSHLDIVLCNI